MKIPYKTKQFWNSAIKFLVVCLSCIFIYHHLQEVPLTQWQLIGNSSSLFLLVVLGVSFSLMNWFLEACKWKTLLKTTQLISLAEALSQSLKAHSVSLITPNKIGEFGAKASFYPKSLRSQILKLTLTGQLYQLAATLGFGILGIVVMFSQFPDALKLPVLIACSSFMFGAVGLALIKTQNKWILKTRSYMRSLIPLSGSGHDKAFLWSILRYLCFSHQFYLFLWLFQSDLKYVEIMPVLFSIYLISSIVPTFLILDATLKASLGLLLLSPYFPSEFILISSLCSWVFNFALPAFWGNILLLKRSRSPLRTKPVL